jgi:hypothetical protein
MSPLLSFVWRRRHQSSPQSSSVASPSSTAEKLPSAIEIATNTTTGTSKTRASNKELNIHPTICSSDMHGGAPPIGTLTSCSSSEDESTMAKSIPVIPHISTYHKDGTSRHPQNHPQVHLEPVPTISSTTTTKVAAVTPDGFKPRRSISDIRNELIQFRDDASHRQEQQQHTNRHTGPQSTTKPTTTNTSAVVLNDNNHCRAIVPVPAMQQQQHNEQYRRSYMYESNALQQVLVSRTEQPPLNINHFVNHDTKFNSKLAVLPPLPIRSWSTEGTTTPATNASSQNYLGSSTGRVSFATNGSANSNASRSMMQQITPTAESPHLEPGRTRTAVGNLIVSMEQNMQLDPPGATPLQDISHHYTQDASTWEYSPQEQNVETMFSPLCLNNRSLCINSNAQNRSIHKSAKSHRSGTSSTIRIVMKRYTATSMAPKASELVTTPIRGVFVTRHCWYQLLVDGMTTRTWR